MRRQCQHCGADLADNHSGTCPKCGSEKQSIFVSATNKMGLTDSVGWRSHREYYEKHPMAFAAVLFISVVSPFAGFFVDAVWGTVIGLVCSAVTFYLGPFVSTKVQEIRHG